MTYAEEEARTQYLEARQAEIANEPPPLFAQIISEVAQALHILKLHPDAVTVTEITETTGYGRRFKIELTLGSGIIVDTIPYNDLLPKDLDNRARTLARVLLQHIEHNQP